MKIIREGENIVMFRHWFRWYYTVALDDRAYMRLWERQQ